MTRMTGPDCAVMCNLINIHTYIRTYIHTCVCMHAHPCIYLSMHYLYMYVSMYICSIYVCIYVSMYLHLVRVQYIDYTEPGENHN